jgi:putative ABC transport system ATP-binding protein
VGGARLLLADEPTGNLDQGTAQGILQLLTDATKAGVTLVVVTHDLELAARLDRRVRLRDGRLES